MNNFFLRIVPLPLLVIIVVSLVGRAQSTNTLPTYTNNNPQYVDYVRPFVGTQGEGNTYPGAVAPFGMLQLSPDTEDSYGRRLRATSIRTARSSGSA